MKKVKELHKSGITIKTSTSAFQLARRKDWHFDADTLSQLPRRHIVSFFFSPEGDAHVMVAGKKIGTVGLGRVSPMIEDNISADLQEIINKYSN